MSSKLFSKQNYTIIISTTAWNYLKLHEIVNLPNSGKNETPKCSLLYTNMLGIRIKNNYIKPKSKPSPCKSTMNFMIGFHHKLWLFLDNHNNYQGIINLLALVIAGDMLINSNTYMLWYPKIFFHFIKLLSVYLSFPPPRNLWRKCFQKSF